MDEYGLAEPEFIDMESVLRINLYRAINVNQYNNTENALKSNVCTQEQIILDYLNENGSITSTILADLLGVKKRRAQTILARLSERRVVRKEGASRSTRYVREKN